MMKASASAKIRARLNHPVIDADGHMIEFEGGILDSLHEVGGDGLVKRFNSWTSENLFRWNRMSPEQRWEHRVARNVWWGVPTRNTLDRATATLPRLLYQRLDDMGLDLVMLYPTLGLPLAHLEDEELRRGASRAFNRFYADVYREFSNRIVTAAIIPMHTPEEGVEELDYAVKECGHKVVMLPSYVRRPVAALARRLPEAASSAFWLDTLGLDSAYDYDPFWRRCIELKAVPTFHSLGIGWGSRTSVSNFVYNRIGHFAAAGEAVCKSLFFGGVTRRFPALKFAFLECGVGWACNLYSDLVGHWEKRNLEALEYTKPANLDRELLLELYGKYGGKMMEGKIDWVRNNLGLLEVDQEDPETLDELAACEIERAEDIRDLFLPHFYFGCEADDPMSAWAFNRKLNPFGGRLNALFSSDIGHWDVADMTEVVAEAHELVEKELITDDDFRDFVFANPVSFYAGVNPHFFEGTVVEAEAQKLLSGA